MSFEIDYMPVGEGEKSGDSIALRFGNLAGPRNEQSVIVIDGGFKESGENLISHISKYYNTDIVDIVISTHPDADHASGLSVVLEKMKVRSLFMHKPWDHADEIKNLFKDGKITASGLEGRLEKSLQSASDLESLAKKKNIPIYEPFQGFNLGNVLHVLGPSEEYYKMMLAHFHSTPEPKKELNIFAPIKKAAEEAVRWLDDHIGLDLINDDDDTTSAENNTSAIVLINLDGRKLLFTGDAGKTALLSAADYATNAGISLDDLGFLDVPHHGSKRNLSTSVLNKIKAGTAFVSASADSPKHPAKKITNALKKRGTNVFVTRGSCLCHHYQGADRGWGPANAEPFYARVEE